MLFRSKYFLSIIISALRFVFCEYSLALLYEFHSLLRGLLKFSIPRRSALIKFCIFQGLLPPVNKCPYLPNVIESSLCLIIIPGGKYIVFIVSALVVDCYSKVKFVPAVLVNRFKSNIIIKWADDRAVILKPYPVIIKDIVAGNPI